jgi:hypothetical protein
MSSLNSLTKKSTYFQGYHEIRHAPQSLHN